MRPFRQLLRAVTADGRVTPLEWARRLRPAIDATPKQASSDARALLEVWASDDFDIDPAVRTAMADALEQRGYPALATTSVAEIIRENVTEPDQAFEQLLALAGRPEATTVVALLDTGVKVDHPALADKLWTNPGETAGNGIDDDGNGFIDDLHGWDFFASAGDIAPGSHGTHVAGLATQGTARLKAMALHAVENNKEAMVFPAIEYAAKSGARVLNLSVQTSDPATVTALLGAMRSQPQMLFVLSAGNDEQTLGSGAFAPETFLAANALPNLVVVAASNEDGSVGSLSNRGAPYVDVAAHGVGVLSTVPGSDGFGFKDGTSMAAPNVTAIAGKALALDPTLTPEQVKRLLIETAEPRAEWAGLVEAGGTVNGARAMRLAALRHLVKAGATATGAADQLGLDSAERATLLGLLPRYV